jgi:hypothetical protein
MSLDSGIHGSGVVCTVPLGSGEASAARRAEERRVVVRRAAPLDEVEPSDVDLLADGLRAAGLRVDARRAVRFAVPAARRVVLAARRVVEEVRAAARDDAPRAICCTCLLSPSRRLNTLSRSACVAFRRTWVWSWSIAVLSVFCPSLMVRSSCRRRSGGTRLSASRRAFLPAVTARPTRPDRLDRDDVRFLVAISQPPFAVVKNPTVCA